MILDTICQAKNKRLEALKSHLPFSRLEALAAKRSTPPLSLFDTLKTSGLSVIAEVKKASPSKGLIEPNFHPVEKARLYEANGADALSVLTEEDFFLGHMDYLQAIRKEVSLPLLCKDFMLEEYQILQAYSMGADAILLIAAILDDKTLARLFAYAKSLGLSVLMEAHTREEVERLTQAGGQILGINNRDLNTFKVDLNTFPRLRAFIPKNCAAVCESGIQNGADAAFAYENGADAILVGESLMRSGETGSLLKSLRLGAGEKTKARSEEGQSHEAG